MSTTDPNLSKKEIVQAKDAAHDDIVLVCKHIFNEIEPYVSGKKLVVVMGETGSGKSTMMASLIYGPDKLEIKEVM